MEKVTVPLTEDTIYQAEKHGYYLAFHGYKIPEGWNPWRAWGSAFAEAFERGQNDAHISLWYEDSLSLGKFYDSEED